jgi:hypothetical protein
MLNAVSGSSGRKTVVPIFFLHIKVLKAASIDPDYLVVGDRLIFEVENAPDGRIRVGNVRRPG